MQSQFYFYNPFIYKLVCVRLCFSLSFLVILISKIFLKFFLFSVKILYFLVYFFYFIKDGCSRETTKWINFTNNGRNVIRFYCDGHTMDNTRSCCCLYRIKGKFIIFITRFCHTTFLSVMSFFVESTMVKNWK